MIKGSKKDKWKAIKEMVFAYLAVTKIMYWFGLINTVNQDGAGDLWQTVLARILHQDLPLVITVVLFHFLDKMIRLRRSKYSKVLEYIVFYAIGFVAIVGIYFIHGLLVFGINAMTYMVNFLVNFAIGYIIVAAILEIKYRIKFKSKPLADDRCAMLQTLLDDGILTQEEFDSKKGILDEKVSANKFGQ
ncbi:MAG: hypothetical protein FWE21_02585 [Defluviitaleaceae bacterium]|nr:hypothetical protein [Defluviitaleaceae bacterium]